MTGIEYDAELAERAKANLAPYPTVNIVEGDGASVRLAHQRVLESWKRAREIVRLPDNVIARVALIAEASPPSA